MPLVQYGRSEVWLRSGRSEDVEVRSRGGGLGMFGGGVLAAERALGRTFEDVPGLLLGPLHRPREFKWRSLFR